MAHICNSCDGMAIALTNPPSNSTLDKSTLIPITIDNNFDLGAPTRISNTTPNFPQEMSIQEHCVHGCKERMHGFMEKEPHRIQFRPIKYTGRSRIADAINENFSEILVDGVPNSHLTICKCKRLIVRGTQFVEGRTPTCKPSSILLHAHHLKMKLRRMPQLMNPNRKF